MIPAAYDPWTALIASKEVTAARHSVADILKHPPRPYRKTASTAAPQDAR